MTAPVGSGRLRTRHALGLLAGVALLFTPLAVVHLTTRTGWSRVWARLAELTPVQLLALVALWSGGLFVNSFVATGALPGLGHRRALALTLSGSTVSQLAPFGGVLGAGLGYSMVRSWGFTGKNFAVLTLLTTACNALVKLLLPVVALAVLAGSGLGWSRQTVVVAAAGLTLILAGGAAIWIVVRDNRGGRSIIARTSVRLRHVTNRSLHDTLTGIRSDIQSVVHRSWVGITAGALGYVFLQAALLYICLAILGHPMSPSIVFAAYATGSALTLVPITPGGVGFAEASTAALLVSFGGPPSVVAAAVLLYSMLTRMLEIPFGIATTFGWLFARARGMGD